MIYLLVFSILNISNRLKHSNAYVTLDLVLLIQMKMKLEIEYNIYIKFKLFFVQGHILDLFKMLIA